MRAKLLLKILVSIVMEAAATIYAVVSVQIGGMMNSDFTAAAVIQQRCPFHLVRPGWVTGTDQGDILLRWWFAEIRVRAAVLFLLWALTVGALVWQYFRRQRHERVG
jgi:hypothetical protein